MKAHETNTHRIKTDEYGVAHYQVVFYGDGWVERWNGLSNNQPFNGSQEIQQYFQQHFTYDSLDSTVNCIALGITDDFATNLLWRLENGEMPETLDAWVFWLGLGLSDLVQGQCSEQAVVSGIVNIYQKIHQGHPQSVVVIQGILPYSNLANGQLESLALDTDRPNDAGFWKTIQAINKQVEHFCSEHDFAVYFDASPLFIKQELFFKTPSLV